MDFDRTINKNEIHLLSFVQFCHAYLSEGALGTFLPDCSFADAIKTTSSLEKVTQQRVQFGYGFLKRSKN